jgi:hypothetical protein
MTGLSLKLSFDEMCVLKNITFNLASVLCCNKHSLYMISGIVLHDLNKRLLAKVALSFQGKRSVRLNLKECHALKYFLCKIVPDENRFEEMIRLEIFLTIDKKIL